MSDRKPVSGHVRKEDLRAGSVLKENPPFAAFDVVLRRDYDALLAELEALKNVHVTQASHDLLVAEGWLDPEHVDAARSVWAKVDGYVPARHRLAMEEALGVRGGEEQRT